MTSITPIYLKQEMVRPRSTQGKPQLQILEGRSTSKLQRNHFNGIFISFKGTNEKRTISELENMRFPAIIRNVPTGNVIPEYNPNENYAFTIGDYKKSKPTKKENATTFRPEELAVLGHEQEIGIRLSYGKNLPWDESKICRDIMQNFFDANGYRLDGVNVSVDNSGEKTKVRISSGSTFSYRHLQSLGATSKTGDQQSAGAFGEGSRMVATKILSDYGADKVTYASANWQMDFVADQNNQEAEVKSVLTKKDDLMSGNYLEFELPKSEKTTQLISKLFDSINYFEHSDNPDFREFDLSNEWFSIKMLPKCENGNLYLIQKYGYQHKFDKCSYDMNLVFHKLPNNFNKDRDRSGLNEESLYSLCNQVAEKLSDTELIRTISVLKPIWLDVRVRDFPDDCHVGRVFFSAFANEAKFRGIQFNFEDKYVARPDTSDSMLAQEHLSFLTNAKHYKFALTSAKKLGAPTALEALATAKTRTELEPTEIQKQKIELLRAGAKALICVTNDVELAQYDIIPLPTNYSEGSGNHRTAYSLAHGEYWQDGFVDEKTKNAAAKKLTTESPEKEIREQAEIINAFIRKALNDNVYPEYTLLMLLGLVDLHNDIKNNERFRKRGQVLEESDTEKPVKIFAPKFHSDPAAEAITANNKFEGMWISNDVLDNYGYIPLLTIFLHEMTHKHGSDISAEFSYKLTDLIEEILTATVKNPNLGKRLKELEIKFKSLH